MLKRKFIIFCLLFSFSCSKDYKPKPKGELRLDYPSAKYEKFERGCRFSFEINEIAKIYDAKQPCWYNLYYPSMKANIHITYFPVHGDFPVHVKEAEKMVYEHTVKASAISTKSFSYPEKNVYGNFYELSGASASNVQFFVTDSTKHFVTGDLYFKSIPKPDSLAPAVDYIKNDILHLIETFYWKN